jgi:type II secretion system protein F
MPEFTYKALDKSGQVSTGTITARDNQDAALKVRALGVFPTAIGAGAKAVGTGVLDDAAAAASAKKAAPAVASSGKKVTRLQVLLFTREMSDLLDAGLPMDRAFSVLLDQADSGPLRHMLNTMQGEIRAGTPLSDALRKFPREFSDLYCNMVRAGEVSGQLSGVMTRLAEFLEKEAVRRSQILSALTYPAVLIFVAISAVIFLMTFAIPRLAPVFKDMGADLPLPTTILMGFSGFVGKFWWVIVLAIVGGVFLFRTWVATRAGHYAFDKMRLNTPPFGTLVQKIVAARLVRTLGTLLGGGVPILEAMDISASAVGNMVATEAILTVRGAVRQGETLHEAMDKAGNFLPVVTHMTAVGEETGRLPQMLIRTAETLDFEVDSAMRRLTSLVEPLVVLFMGVFIGFIVLSILLPIFQISSLVK